MGKTLFQNVAPSVFHYYCEHLSHCIDLLGFGADSSVDMTASPVVNIASVFSVWIRYEVPSLVKVVYNLHFNLSVIPIRHVAT